MLTDPSYSQQEVSNIQCSRCIGCKHYHIFRHFIHTLVRTLSLLYLGFRWPWLTKMALNCNLNLVCLRRTSSVRPLSRSTPAWSVNNSNRSSRWSSSSNSCKSNSRALRSDKWMPWGNESVPCQYVSPISVCKNMNARIAHEILGDLSILVLGDLPDSRTLTWKLFKWYWCWHNFITTGSSSNKICPRISSTTAWEIDHSLQHLTPGTATTPTAHYHYYLLHPTREVEHIEHASIQFFNHFKVNTKSIDF